jgi:predicted MFS family arabinose efflux permease
VDDADPPAPQGLWRHADFLKLWSAQTISAFGARISREGLPWTAILTLQAGPGALGVLAALSRGSGVVVGLLAGGLVDRSHRRTIMIACDMVRAGLLLAVPVLALMHHLTIWVLYAAAPLVGGASVLFDIADQAFLPSLVDRNQLVDANGKLAATDAIAEMGGPAIAGPLIQLLGPPIALAVNAATYLASALFLRSLRKVETRAEVDLDAEPPTRLSDLVAGFRALNGDPVVRAVAIVVLVQGLFGGIFSALYMLFAIRGVGLAPAILGLVIAMGGVGGLIGAAVGPWLARRLGLGVIAAAGALIGGVSLALIPLAHGPVAMGAAFLIGSQLLSDSFATASVIGLTSLRQSRLAPEVMGRAGAALAAGSGGLTIIGAVGGGLLGAAIGLRATMWIAVAGFTLAGVWAVASPIRTAR